MTRSQKSILLLGVLVILILAIFGLMRAIKPSLKDANETHHVATLNGETVITLDTTTIVQSGIKTAPLSITTQPEWIQAFGITISPQELAEARNNYVIALTQFQKAQATFDTSNKEIQRARALHRDHQNISDKALQLAAMTWQTDKANLDAAQANLQTQETLLYNRWGKTISQWIVENNTTFSQLLQQQNALVQATLPLGISQTPKQQPGKLQTDQGTWSDIIFIDVALTSDSRLQGLSFFYLLTNKPATVLPGATMRVFLPVGEAKEQVIIPQSAVVWWQGKAWIYLQTKPNEFVRREIPTTSFTSKGWLVPPSFSTANHVVIVGGQLLLSEESRAAMPQKTKEDND